LDIRGVKPRVRRRILVLLPEIEGETGQKFFLGSGHSQVGQFGAVDLDGQAQVVFDGMDNAFLQAQLGLSLLLWSGRQDKTDAQDNKAKKSLFRFFHAPLHVIEKNLDSAAPRFFRGRIEQYSCQAVQLEALGKILAGKWALPGKSGNSLPDDE
jgi:hypothetical protein